MTSQLSGSAGGGQPGQVLLSCYAPSFENGFYASYDVDEDGEVVRERRWRSGYLGLLLDADKEGLRAWNRKKRMASAFDLLEGRHVGEDPLWLRWSHPGAVVDELLTSWHRYGSWWRRTGAVIDLLAVVDRGLQGERVWHIHGLGFGPDIDMLEHAAQWGTAGGYPFVKVSRRKGAGEARKYVLSKLRGYMDRKTGARRLSLRVGVTK